MMGNDEQPPQPEITPEQIAEMLGSEIAFTLSTLMGPLGPPRALSEESFESLVAVLVEEQVLVQGQVMQSFLGPDREARPQLFVEVRGPTGVVGRLVIDKQIDAADPGKALTTALGVALLLNAGVRGLLRLHGYDYRFFEVKDPTPKPKIVLVGG